MQAMYGSRGGSATMFGSLSMARPVPTYPPLVFDGVGFIAAGDSS